MSKYGNYTMRYDELGNPISYKGYSMVWTKGRQLAALSDTQTTMAFKYDSNGIRTLKRVNGVDTEFTYAGTTLISQKTGNEVINFAYTAGGAPYGFTYNGTNYFYLLNLQGDVIGIYDSTGTVVVKYAYDSWGQLMSITGTLADTIGVKNPLRYRGYYYDTETKLYYLQSRYYDPETCHFISMDSYFIAGDYINGMNMYAYCLNNPVMYVDPTGYAYDPVFDTYDSNQEALAAAIAALAVVCGAVQYIYDYGISLGYSTEEIDVSLGEFLGRTAPLHKDSIFELANILLVGVSVMTGSAWWTSIYSDSSMMKDLIDVMKQNFVMDLGIKGAALFATSIFVDMVPEFLNPLNSNVDLISALGKHAFIETGGLAITASGFAVAAALTAVNPIFGAAVGAVWIVAGNEAWKGATSSM